MKRLRVHLHIGAHKTASTFVQKRLERSAGALEPHGVAVVHHSTMRKTVSDRIDLATHLGGAGLALAQTSITRAMKALVAKSAGARLIVMSDENLLGPMDSVGAKSGMYPQAGPRIRALLSALPDCDARVFMAVRDYPDMLSSAFAHASERGRAMDLDLFTSRCMRLRRSWADVVADVCDAAGAGRVTVWTFEDFIRDGQAVSDALVGEGVSGLFPANNRPKLASLSAKGMAVMERVAPMLSESERKRFARMVARFHFDAPDGKLRLFDTEAEHWLRARYEDDLREIAGFGCTLVGAGRLVPASS